MLVLFLGLQHRQLRSAGRPTSSSREIRRALRPGDALLLGADLVKPERELLLAYDDPLGVTAAFNKNLLVRINRELGGDFDLDGFRPPRGLEPEASAASRCTSSRAARSRSSRSPAPAATSRFEAGETIWTESSYKYTAEQVHAMGAAAGFRSREQWIEPDARFALTLFLAD